MIGVDEVLGDPEMGAASFLVTRTNYRRTRGQLVDSTTLMEAEGCIHPGTPEMLQLVPEEERKDFKDMFLKVTMLSSEGDKMRVNLPMLLVQTALDTGVSITGSPALKQLDLQQIITLVQQGATGEIVEMESSDGDILRVVVE